MSPEGNALVNLTLVVAAIFIPFGPLDSSEDRKARYHCRSRSWCYRTWNDSGFEHNCINNAHCLLPYQDPQKGSY